MRLREGLMTGAMMMVLLAAPGSATYAAQLPADTAHNQATDKLFSAVHANDFSAVQASIAAGADVEARNSWGVTPADLAVDKGYFRIAHYLVSVRNFQHTKTEQVPAPSTQAGGNPVPLAGNKATAAATGGRVATSTPAAASPVAHAGTTRTPAVPAPVTSVPTTASATTAAATAPTAANTATTTAWRPEDGPNPFDPHTPAYGSTGPADSN